MQVHATQHCSIVFLYDAVYGQGVQIILTDLDWVVWVTISVLIRSYERFGGTCRFHLQVRKSRQQVPPKC